MGNGYITLNGEKYPIEVSYVEIGNKDYLAKMKKAIDERRQLMKALEKRSAELRAEAARIRYSDPFKARMLEHRGIVLADEAYRIRKENENPMKPAQIRRSAALAWLALEKDGICK